MGILRAHVSSRGDRVKHDSTSATPTFESMVAMVVILHRAYWGHFCIQWL